MSLIHKQHIYPGILKENRVFVVRVLRLLQSLKQLVFPFLQFLDDLVANLGLRFTLCGCLLCMCIDDGRFQV